MGCCGLLPSFSQSLYSQHILLHPVLRPAPAPLRSQVQCQALGEDLPPPVASQAADRCPRFWWSAPPSHAGPVKDGEQTPPAVNCYAVVVLKCSEVFQIHTQHLEIPGITSTPLGTKCDPSVLQWRFSAVGGRQEGAQTAEVLLELPLAPPPLPQGP